LRTPSHGAPQCRPLCAPGPKEHEAQTSLFASRRPTGILCDPTAVPDGVTTSQDDPDKLRRIQYHDRAPETTLVVLTHDGVLPSQTLADLYRAHWHIALFFKGIKQTLRIKAFFGTSETAVKSPIWIAVSVYVLVAIIRNRLTLDMSLHTILQILSVTPFEKMTLHQLLSTQRNQKPKLKPDKQLKLFD